MSDHGDFSGEPKTAWLIGESAPDRNMEILEDFFYTDPEGREWPAYAGYKGLNGASIPRALWSLIGAPYVGDYRRAALVHDYAVQEGPATRLEADRMFYHACRAGGCSWLQARILYVGVRLGACFDDYAELKAAFGVTSEYPRLTRSSGEARAEELFLDICHAALVEQEVDDVDDFAERVDIEIEKRVATYIW